MSSPWLSAPSGGTQRDRGAAVMREVDSESDAAEQLEEEQPVDSSDEEESPVGAADHEGAAGGRQVAGYTALTQWCRDDDYGMDERAKHGFNDQSGPRLNGMSDWENASLFALAKHFLPMNYIGEMANLMEQRGQKSLPTAMLPMPTGRQEIGASIQQWKCLC
ncbi:hypothetical protein AB1Y20_006736 [Prymnesium parvum]|uniref:Uncharacterized protein n=1 Tax=Prymnesium parvum TaxID=97485 RepID=A0AB34J154_PRYPA